ncbi:hypothetical protein VMCG_03396 [Cytospora schulzeri]|uniref:Uncharacterized protein n=1 Tax=Cytospora schulzeri TaxID=448051 RepID=A0A423WWT6_9PEZI|nr:hypothetical protein VMCG_03396 [Valsa malicola]
MSRASFSIRKLINQRRTWPDSDSDNEEAFECSSAKTIRLQYELEQYQQQQLQKDIRHQHRTRSSWMGNSSSSPKRKGHKRIPKPIVVVSHNHHSNDIVVQNGSGFIEGETEKESEAVPENVQQLIWETDEAFKAVGTALAEARLASQSHPQSKELQVQVQELQRASRFLQSQSQSQGLDKTPLKILPPPLVRTRNTPGISSPISPTSGRGTIPASFRKTQNKSSPLSPSPDILRSPTRGASIKKAKRKSPIRPNKTSRSATAGPSTPGIWPDLPSATPKSSTFSPSAARQNNSNSSSGHRAHHSYSRSLSKWNLKADNVTEKLFNGSRGRFGLHKIQADEVVTPGQVQQYRQSRIAKAQAEAQAEALKSSSNESLRSNAGSTGGANSDANSSVNTPVEPFHLQDLPSRIGNSGLNLNVLSPVVEVPTPGSFTFETDKDTTPRETTFWTEPKTPTVLGKQARQEQTPLATPPPTPPQPSPSAFATAAAPSGEEDAPKSARSHSYPSQSPSNKSPSRPTHKRAASSSSRVPVLPTIPEVRVTAPQVLRAPPSPQPQAQNPDGTTATTTTTNTTNSTCPYFEEDDEHIFLQSTSFTQTMPTFQHGRIRLAKADLVDNGMINSFESRLLSSPDEGLDWTAFQMAILGGAGDLLSDPADFLSRDAHEDLVDDLCDWWGGFGLSMATLGTLVTEQEERRRATAVAAPFTTMATPMMMPTAYTPGHGHGHVTAISPPGSETRSFHDPSRNHSINHIVSGSSISSDMSSSGDSTSSARSSGEISDVEEMVLVQSMPIPISSEHPSGFWNTRPFDASRFFTGEGCGIKRWTLEGHPKRYQGPGIDVNKANGNAEGYGGKPSPGNPGGFKNGGGRGATRESVDSLPQSPMLDLVMTTAVDGSKEFVPMGYNLGHDLGDFLKWESENVYATAFYGAD